MPFAGIASIFTLRTVTSTEGTFTPLILRLYSRGSVPRICTYLPSPSRSVVDRINGKCKTETSRRPVPIDELTTAELLAWRLETCYAEPEDWVFASERVQGKMPPWADTLLDRLLQPAAKRAGITKWVGFHTFRHTYSTLLKANGEDVKVVQELMRHANISTTMNIYTKALTSAKREAQSRVVDVLLDRSRNVVERAAEDAA